MAIRSPLSRQMILAPVPSNQPQFHSDRRESNQQTKPTFGKHGIDAERS